MVLHGPFQPKAAVDEKIGADCVRQVGGFCARRGWDSAYSAVRDDYQYCRMRPSTEALYSERRGLSSINPV